jgi:nucleotidyltransferase AbiEii toxin of type IV toxin-antitoxin system
MTIEINYPTDAQIRAFAGEYKIPVAAVVRDLARIVEVSHLVEEGFLGQRVILTGGMALRCYESKRYTMRDTDTSAFVRIDDDELEAVIPYEDERISIQPEDPGQWDINSALRTVQPIRFEPRFTGIQLGRDQREFSLNVSWRGVELDPVELPFLHQYPWGLGTEAIRVPVMDIREILAEKVLGFCINSLAKHYSDLAFIGDVRYDDVADDRDLLRWLVASKLAVNLRHIPRRCEKVGVTEYEHLRARLGCPEEMGVHENWNVRYATTGRTAYSFDDAKLLIVERIVPLLFD